MDIAIMYHYVREKGDWNGIFPLRPSIFEDQIDILSNYYDIVSPVDLDKARKSKPRCVLTFDDGTKDQYTNAFQIMKRKGIPGYFSVMSGPLVNRTVPVFNLVHTVLSFYPDEEIWDGLNELYDLSKVPELSGIYAYEKDIFRRYNKYTFNFYLSESDARAYLEEKAYAVFGSKEKFIEAFYVNKIELIEMKQAGMTIGVHCVNHNPYLGEANKFFENEVQPCTAFLEKEIGVKPEWYTPAYGGGEKYKEMSKDLEPILINNGFRGGFTTVPGVNQGLSKFWLNRFDCINIPPCKNVNFNDLQ